MGSPLAPPPPLFELRPFQREALEALRTHPRLHLVCTAATGAGKSLIYETLLQDKPTRMVLVSPLVALARQQLANLKRLGIHASQGLPDASVPVRTSAAAVLSPEHFTLSHLTQRVAAWRPHLLVIDECHCIETWETFRPAFRTLLELPERIATARSLWMTATLTPQMRGLLEASLPAPTRFIGGFSLPPLLAIRVLRVPAASRMAFVHAQLSRHPESAGLVFAPTRQLCEQLARGLREVGFKVMAYHAGFSREERAAIEVRFKQGEWQALIATSAFGMGMDVPGIRWTVLLYPPPDLAQLAQAIGRCTRHWDTPAEAWVLWDPEDFYFLRPLEEVRRFVQSADCRAKILTAFFEGPPVSACGRCDHCLGQI